jgi:hypothetical protein
MSKIPAYLAHAKDCNVMALSAASDEHRKLLHEMANTWRTLAREHARMTGQAMPDAEPRAGELALPTLPPAPPKKSNLQSLSVPASATLQPRSPLAAGAPPSDPRAAKVSA